MVAAGIVLHKRRGGGDLCDRTVGWWKSVNVEFQVEADGTRVTLVHTGWHLTGMQASALQADYTAQWAEVLELCFAEFVCACMEVAV